MAQATVISQHPEGVETTRIKTVPPQHKILIPKGTGKYRSTLGHLPARLLRSAKKEEVLVVAVVVEAQKTRKSLARINIVRQGAVEDKRIVR